MSINLNCEEKDEEELIKLTLENQQFFACVIKRYEDKIGRYIKRISGGNDQDAEDLLQEIFIKAYQNLRDFDPDLKFSSWLYRVAHNHIISSWRKQKAKPQLIGGEEIEEFLESIASDINIEVDIHNKDLQNEVRQVLEQMDIKYREVLVLKFLEEKDYKEISDILRKPMGTVATLINRAKKQFRQKAKEVKAGFI